MSEELLAEALRLYPFTAPNAQLIRHNENATYRVVDGETYVLRIHRPAAGFTLGMFGVTGHTAELLGGEMAFIASLRAGTDIPMQTPVECVGGRLVGMLSDGTPVTALTWLEGETLEHAGATQDLLRRVGEMTAKMHRHAQGVTAALQRYAYGPGMLPRIAASVAKAADASAITAEQCACMQGALAKIRARMDELDAMPGGPCIVHSDLSAANLIVRNGAVSPIDFCLCGYSHIHMDIGSLYGHWSTEPERRALIDGYEAVAGTRVDFRYVEPYFALQVLLFIASQYERAKDWAWFGGAVGRWCRDIFLPLSAGDTILVHP